MKNREILLNKEQIEAINTTKGNLLILASAGTGKTTTIVERYVNLVENHKFNPNEIMMTTFTNKAAKDMVEKIRKRTDKIPFYVGTMHYLFLKIIRENAEKLSINPNFTLLTEENDKKKIIRDILTGRNIDPATNNVNYLLSRIEKSKNRGINAEDLGDNLDLGDEDKLIEEEIAGGEFVTVNSNVKMLSNYVYKKYQERLKELNKLDFDDILLYAYLLFDKNNEIRKSYQTKLKAIMVDEAQDLNIVQRNILELLQDDNLCLIGDDCQNIYSWRGTSNEFIFNFDKSCKKIVLKENYRSSEEIINNVNRIIDSITFKIDKKLNCTRKGGESIKIKEFNEFKDEISFTAFKIKNLLSKKEFPENIAILFRTNRMGKQIERVFRKNNIPCHLSKSIGFFEREEIKDILSFIKLKLNHDSLFEFERLLNLVEGVGKKRIEQLQEIANNEKINIFDSLKHLDELDSNMQIKEKLSKLKLLLDNQNNNPIESFIKFFNYKKELEKKYSSDPEKIDDKIENINVLSELIKDYDFNDLGIRDFLDSLIDMERKEKNKDKVVLTTIHSAKGLEWKYVYLLGCNETILPSYRGKLNKIKKDDELRLFYVAVSRTKDFLTLTYSLNHDYKELEPSQFLEIIKGDFEDED